MLQVFSDRRTNGFGPEDGGVGAWQVPWIDPEAPRGIVELPHGNLVEAHQVFMVLARCDLPTDLPRHDAADAVNVVLARAWDGQEDQRVLEQPVTATHR